MRKQIAVNKNNPGSKGLYAKNEAPAKPASKPKPKAKK